MTLPDQDLKSLTEAKQLLENPGLAIRLTDYIGRPIERGVERLPDKWRKGVLKASKEALDKALGFAINSLGMSRSFGRNNFYHKLFASALGAGGGALGLPGLAVELPVSTIIMLRSIAEIAKSEGENLGEIEAKLECLRVFSFGGISGSDDAAESAYFPARMALAGAVDEAVRHVALHGIGKNSAPVLLMLVGKIAGKFSIQVSQKAAAQAVPVIGALGGATINYIFTDHFQNMARGHFIVRRLEREYGNDTVRRAYEQP